MQKEAPFIYLFKTPRCFYFLDVNKDTIVSVSETIYHYLEKVVGGIWEKSGSLFDDSDTDMLTDHDKSHLHFLLSRGYLSSKRIKTIRHPDIKNLEYYQNHRCEQLILQVTQACNLKCSYCPFASKTEDDIVRNHSSKTMSIELAKRSVDFYAQHSDELEVAKIGFYGGEPFIAFDLIREVVEYAKKVIVGKDIIFSVTTNGTLLNDEEIDYLVKNRFVVLFSIDGPQNIHDKNRIKVDGAGSFDEAYSNYLKVVRAFDEKSSSNIAFNMVLDPTEDLQLTIDFLEQDEISDAGILIMADIPEDFLLENKIHITENYLSKKRYLEFAGYMKYLNIIPGVKSCPIGSDELETIDRLYERFKSKNNELPSEGAPGGPCIPGTKKLFVNVNGDFFPCEKVNENSPAVRIGSIDEGFDLENSKRVLDVGSLSSEKCRNCFAIAHCRICAKLADDGRRLSKDYKMRNCNDSISAFVNELYACALIKESKTVYKNWR